MKEKKKKRILWNSFAIFKNEKARLLIVNLDNNNDFELEMNIKDDSVSFNLLRKKISSNLKNFDGINEVENNENK